MLRSNIKIVKGFIFSTIIILSACGSDGNSNGDEGTDSTAPVITLTGINPQIIEGGSTYIELGATAADDVDGDISANIIIDASSVATDTVNTWSVTYNVSDAAGNNAAEVLRVVEIVDTTAPIINLIGANPQTINLNEAYVELGASATDNVINTPSLMPQIDVSAVDISTLGSYEVTYDVTDAEGNVATTVIRTVNVIDPAADNTAPTVVITFPTATSLTRGDTVTVRGTASDPSGIADIIVNGINASTSDNYANWSVEISLSPGINNLTVTSLDNNANQDNQAALAVIESSEVVHSFGKLTLDTVNNRTLVIGDGVISVVDLDTGVRTIFSGPNTPNANNPIHSPSTLVLDVANNRALVTNSDDTQPSLVEVNLVTGVSTIISNNTTPDDTNSFSRPGGLVLDSANNRVLVIDFGLDAVLAVDLADGARTVISDNNMPNANHSLRAPAGIVLDGDRALVVDAFLDAVLTVDLSTGAREILSNQTIPDSNNVIDDLNGGISLDSAANRILVTGSNTGVNDDQSLGVVMSVDLNTGVRTILSNESNPDNNNALREPEFLALDNANNRVLVTDGSLLLAVSLSDGTRTIILDSGVPDSNNEFGRAGRLVLDSANNRALVLNDNFVDVALLAVDLSTGARTIFSDNSTPNSSNPLGEPQDLILDSANNRVLITDDNYAGVLAVDLATGARSIFSDNGIPDTNNPFDFPSEMVLDNVNNRALVINIISNFPNIDNVMLLGIDLDTGVRTIISDNTVPNANNLLNSPQKMVLDSDNDRILVIDSGTLLAVDLDTGTRTIVVSDLTSGLNEITSAEGMELDSSNNRVLVVDAIERGVFAIDLTTGFVSKISDGLMPDAMNEFRRPIGLALEIEKNRALVVDNRLNAVVVVDIINGERVFLSKSRSR